MTNRDFDQDDARELAGFAGLGYEVYEEEFDYRGNPIVKVKTVNGEKQWRPWSSDAEQWQIQSCLDAVREKGLVFDFVSEIKIKTGAMSGDVERAFYKVASAPPEAICSAILSMEVD